MKGSVWVTGLGVVTAFGRGVGAFFEGMLRGHSALSPVQGIPTTRGKVLGGQVKSPEFAGPHHLSEMAIAAVEEALAQAGIGSDGCEGTGLFLGTVASEGRIVEDRFAEFAACEAASPELRDGLLRYPNGALADVLAYRFQLTGPRDVNTNACASGNIALARALLALRLGRIERAVVCGADQLRPLMYWGSERAGLMGHDLRPFHKDRDGTIFGDGAGAMVLERIDAAQRRGARPLAALAGWGVVCDENPQLILPQLDGGAVVRCFKSVLDDAGLTPDDVDYVNAHGTGTINIDKIEVLACKRVFGARAAQLPISSTKSLTGHLSSASPLVEGIACILSICNGYIHPTAKLDAPDPDFGLDFVPLQGRYQKVSCAVSNSMGGGGTNAAVVFTEAQRALPERAEPVPLSEVVVTGAGAVCVCGPGRQALIDALLEDRAQPSEGRLAAFDIDEYVDAQLGYKHLSRAAQLALAAEVLAARDAGLALPKVHGERVAVIFGTAFGGTPGWSDLLCSAYLTDPRHITPNMALEHGHHLGVTLIARRELARGANCTLTGGRTAGLEAIAFGADLLRTGACDVAIVGGCDCLDPSLARALDLLGCSAPRGAACAPYSADALGLVPAEGAGCLVLERRVAARERGARVLASLAGFGSASAALPLGEVDGSGVAQAAALRAALEQAGLDGAPVLVYGGANGNPALDQAELAAVRHVAAASSFSPRLLSLQRRLGDTFAAGSVLSVIAGLGCLPAGRIPWWLGRDGDVSHPELALPGAGWKHDALVVTAAAPGGAAAAAVFRSEEG
ncbi:MAG TPA: beta-ketoacyl-[acyl-carrier-protein] synthase family protein [Polyangiaceae bacterium]|nr:beta-ketoacyl-[acyl-carrier-protein] synthase family protein [Polyangiaceae bacterium]